MKTRSKIHLALYFIQVLFCLALFTLGLGLIVNSVIGDLSLGIVDVILKTKYIYIVCVFSSIIMTRIEYESMRL